MTKINININLTPFAGIFLILTTVAATRTPATSAGSMIQMAHRQHPCLATDSGDGVIVEVWRTGRVRLNGQDAELGEISHQLQVIYRGKSERLAFIKAGPDTSFQEVATVIDIARSEGIHVALLTPLLEKQTGCLDISTPSL